MEWRAPPIKATGLHSLPKFTEIYRAQFGIQTASLAIPSGIVRAISMEQLTNHTRLRYIRGRYDLLAQFGQGLPPLRKGVQ
ncbi:MAG: hypothetical protein NZ840_09000 [Anaerolineales bacterium]|nr:hypothetical protein [Anaerolineales bacterium]MDW8162178.1 hypothetical protein [Anaerolineales bacterium]